MAGVRKRGSKWSAILYDRRRKRQTWRTLPPEITGKRQAQQMANDLEADLNKTLSSANTSEPGPCENGWIDAAADVIDEIEIRNGKAWAGICQCMVDRFADYMGDVKISQVTQVDARNYVTHRLSKKANHSTLRKEIILIRRIFRLYGSAAFNDVRLPPEPKHAPRFLDRADFADILEAAPPERQLRWQLLVYTGARRNEARRLTWANVDLRTRTIRLPNSAKGGAAKAPYRLVPIPEPLLATLRGQGRHAASAHLLTTMHNWLRELRTDVRHANAARRAAWKEAGLKPKAAPKIPDDIRVHDLRHTYGSWLVQSGVSLQVVRDLMGHASIKTTEIYAHLAPSQHQAAAQAMAAAPVDRIVPAAKRAAGDA